MALFKSLFGKKDGKKTPKGFTELTIRSIDKLTENSVKVTFDTDDYSFVPGQYLTFITELDGKEQRRSYSICSGPNEPLAVAVKQVENGLVSTWFNQKAEVGMTLLSSKAEGGFIVPEGAKNIVAIAAGSGITPIMSIAKNLESSGDSMRLFYGNRSSKLTMFKNEIETFKNTSCHFYYTDSNENSDLKGRLDKDTFSEIIKSDLSLLKSDCFLVCGPEQMIVDVVGVLELFGVPKEKVKFELFTTPTLLKQEEKDTGPSYEGSAEVTVLLDGEKVVYSLDADGKSILESASDEGVDAPYSCKGGVCSACKAKVLKGKASMEMNFSLSDSEIEEGFILTCQAHPASEQLIVSYDED